MIFCQPKLPPSSFPERLPEYLRRQRELPSSQIVIERLEDDGDEAAIDEVAEVLARSFAGRHGIRPGEAALDFVLGPDFPQSDPKCEARRVEFLRYVQKWGVVACLEYGIVLVAREKQQQQNGSPDRATTPGRVLAAVCALPPEGAFAADVSHSFPRPHFFRILKRMGWKPPPDFVDGGDRRLQIVGQTSAEAHGPANAFSAARNGGVLPWYVWVLGTDVDAQGKGCGTALLEAVHYLADSDGVDAMLEYTEERKRLFYCDKMGYENFGDEIVLKDPKDDRIDEVKGQVCIRPKRQPRLPSM